MESGDAGLERGYSLVGTWRADRMSPRGGLSMAFLLEWA
jgi:hypothetical protein